MTSWSLLSVASVDRGGGGEGPEQAGDESEKEKKEKRKVVTRDSWISPQKKVSIRESGVGSGKKWIEGVILQTLCDLRGAPGTTGPSPTSWGGESRSADLLMSIPPACFPVIVASVLVR